MNKHLPARVSGTQLHGASHECRRYLGQSQAGNAANLIDGTGQIIELPL